jgi:predicted transcriptional regulator
MTRVTYARKNRLSTARIEQILGQLEELGLIEQKNLLWKVIKLKPS